MQTCLRCSSPVDWSNSSTSELRWPARLSPDSLSSSLVRTFSITEKVRSAVIAAAGGIVTSQRDRLWLYVPPPTYGQRLARTATFKRLAEQSLAFSLQQSPHAGTYFSLSVSVTWDKCALTRIPLCKLCFAFNPNTPQHSCFFLRHKTVFRPQESTF